MCKHPRKRRPFPVEKRLPRWARGLSWLRFEPLEERRVLATVSVTSTSDVADGVTSSIAALIGSPGADGVISLREAITAANNTPNSGGPDEIHFDISPTSAGHFYYQNDNVAGQVSRSKVTATTAASDSDNATPDPDWSHSWFTINAPSGMPSITEPLVIDGYTQGNATVTTTDDALPNTNPLSQGLNTQLRVELNGTGGVGDFAGLTLDAGSSGSTIRGLAINRYTAHAVFITNGGSGTVAGNYLGTDVSGLVDLGNLADGVLVINAPNSTIGGATADASNLISGNNAFGVAIVLAPSTGNHVSRNLIGTDASGTRPLGNSAAGVLFFDASNNTVGGDSATANVIAFNTTKGVDVIQSSAATVGNRIRANSIYANGALGIDLADNGVTPNDTSDADGGANNLQNFPVITSVVAGGGGTAITGTLNSVASSAFDLDFYVSNDVDPSGFGEGQFFLGSTSVSTNASGDATFSINLPVVPPGFNFISATATRTATGDTSEFSLALPVAPVSFIVTNTGNTGPGSLRNAIVSANVTPGVDTISFNIPGAGPHVIEVTSDPPIITEAVVIDGYTQPGAALNTNPVSQGLNTVLNVELDGNDVASGLAISSGGSTVRGLAIHDFVGNGITLFTGGGNTITGNFIGTDASGTQGLGNSVSGIMLFDSDNNTIGGTSPGAANVISKSGNNGIYVLQDSTGNVMQGNFIGTNAAGTVSLGNVLAGVRVENSPNNTIGGLTSARNILSGNFYGVDLEGNTATGTIIQDNLIGTDVTGTQDVRNKSAGIEIFTSNNLIQGNTVAFNQLGVQVQFGTGNRITQNSIHTNRDPFITPNIGIDLGFNGQPNFPQDSGDADGGPNNGQNFPILSSVSNLSPGTRVQGTLNSLPNVTFRIEIFANARRDASGFGEGQTFLGTFDVLTDGSGNVTFDKNLPAAPIGQPFITATATNLSTNDTSEFSPPQAIGGATFVVTETGDGGYSLAEAINNSNSTAGTQTITFQFRPDDPRHFYYADDGHAGEVSLANVHVTSQAHDTDIADIDPDWPHSWWSIQPSEKLPALTDTVIIDGYSIGQDTPGDTTDDAIRNSNPVGQGLNTVLRVELDASLLGRDKDGLLQLKGDNSMLQGLALNRFNGPGIQIGSGDGTITIPPPPPPPAITGGTIVGNFLGTDISGTRVFPKPQDPIDNGGTILTRAEVSSITVGGTTPAARNLIATGRFSEIDGFGLSIDVTLRNGIDLLGPGNTVQGNLIGTDVTGTKVLGNRAGVSLGADNNVIGGTNPSGGNVISGSGGDAIDVQGSHNVIQNNRLGTDLAGLANLRNLGGGIQISGSDNLIKQNTIAFNLGLGVLVGSGTGNEITQNLIFLNQMFGIGLRTDTNTPNFPQDADDSDTGNNNLQNSPVVTTVTEGGGGTTISGTLNSLPNRSYRIELFASDRRELFFGVGQGQTMLATVNVTTNGSGFASFSVGGAALPGAQRFVSATATDLTTHDTSEFSQAKRVDPDSFTVTNTDTGGLGSLFEAIFCSNESPGTQTIDFAIAANDPGHVYYKDDGVVGHVTLDNKTPTTATSDASIGDIDPDWPHSWFVIPQSVFRMQSIEDTVIIDGYTQSGASRNTNPVGQGLNTVLKVELQGVKSFFPFELAGLVVGASNTRIEGLDITGWNFGVLTGANTVVAGNFIGTDVSGTQDLGNDDGVVVVTGATIGGLAAADRNLLSGNDRSGVSVTGSGSGNVILGNLIGTTFAGTQSLGNENGIFISGASNNTIGGTVVNARNVISGNGFDGVRVEGLIRPILSPTFPFPATNNLVQGNFIGVNVAGTSPLPNQSDGVVLLDADNNTVGGTDAGAANLLGGNHFDGVFIDSELTESNGNLVQGNFIGTGASGLLNLGNGFTGVHITSANTQNAILGNKIAFNADIGIELDLDENGEDGPTPNDVAPASVPPDQDVGANNLQNFPVLTLVANNGSTFISGALQSTPNTNFRIEFFANNAADPTGFGEGQFPLGTVDVATDGSGDAAIDFTSPILVATGKFVTATATRLDAGLNPIETSEFGPAIVALDSDAPTADIVDITPDPRNTSVGIVTINFSENVSGVIIDDFSLTRNGGAVSLSGLSVSQVTPSQYTVNLSGVTGQAGVYLLKLTAAGLGIQDAQSHPLAANVTDSWTIDTTAPQLQSFRRQNPATSSTSADSLVFRATFNEPLKNVDPTDFAVNGSTTATVTAVASVSGSTYDITVSGGNLAGFNGTVGLNLSGGQNITDAAGNPLPATEPAIDEVYSVTNAAGGGNITTAVVQVGKKTTDLQLKFDGDALDNLVQIDLGPGGVKNRVTLTGLGGTTIDGLPSETFDGITKGLLGQLFGGNDEIIVNGTKVAGPISLDEGEGNDRYVISASKTKFALSDSGGLDTIDFSIQTKASSIDLAKLPGKSQSLGNGNSTTLNGQWENVLGGAGNDNFKGNAVANLLVGNGGNDTLDGREGDDVLLGGAGKDNLKGGLGNDRLDGGTENDKLDGGDGDDILRGGEGNDTLTDTSGHNILLGEGGNDKLTGGKGNKKLVPAVVDFDLLIGGTGADTLTAGKQGNSILIGGTTAHDGDDAALLAILTEWSSGAPLGTRVGNLQAGVGAGNSIKLTTAAPATIIDDGLIDTLKNVFGNNWIFQSPADKLTGKKADKPPTDVVT